MDLLVEGLRSESKPPDPFEPLQLVSAVEALSVTCQASEMPDPTVWAPAVMTTCRAKPVPVERPPDTDYVWRSSDPSVATVTAGADDADAIVTAVRPGSTRILATLEFGSAFPVVLAGTVDAPTLEVKDESGPYEVTLTSTAPALVAPGGSIPLEVEAMDYTEVTRITLEVTDGADAVENPDQEFSCLLLEPSCSAGFVMNVKDSGVTAERITVVAKAFDDQGRSTTSSPLTFTLREDDACPTLTITRPVAGANLPPGAMVGVQAKATDETGVSEFRYTVTGDAVVSPITQPIVIPLNPPQVNPSLDFRFRVENAATLETIPDWAITITVEAIDALGNTCGPKTVEVYTGDVTEDVRVDILWSSGDDLELYVEDPNDDIVSWEDQTIPSGGQWQGDLGSHCDMVGTTLVERVFWPAGRAPRGTYGIGVRNFQDCDGDDQPSPFHLRVIVDGIADTRQFEIEPGEGEAFWYFSR